MATSIKTSQLPAKGANLEATDLVEISEFNGTGYVTKSITGQEIIDSAVGSVDWGDINGTLSAQTDLQTALDGKVDENTAITGATKTKITYDSKGLVTAGADATTADIADSLNKRYVTDANLTTLANTSGTNTGDQTLSGLGGVPTTRTISTTAPLSGGGDLSANRTLSIATANTTTTGALSSTDWNTFNGKQSALVSGTNIKTINGNTILGSGDLTISTGITIGTTAITSGTIGRILFEGTGNVVQESANLFWDNTNGRLGIGGTPSNTLDVNGTFRVYHPTFGNYFDVTSTLTTLNRNAGTAQALRGFSVTPTSGTQAYGTGANYGTMSVGDGTNFAVLGYNWSVTGAKAVFGGITSGGNQLPISLYGRRFELYNQNTVAMTMFDNTGNFLIQYGGTHTDAGYKLDVNGTARVQGKLSVNTPTATSAVMEVTSTTQGFLPPRMTTTQKNAIATPAAGLMVYDTTLNAISYYNGTTWI